MKAWAWGLAGPWWLFRPICPRRLLRPCHIADRILAAGEMAPVPVTGRVEGAAIANRARGAGTVLVAVAIVVLANYS